MNHDIVSGIIRTAKRLEAFIYASETQKALRDLLSQVERHLGQKWFDAVAAAEDGDYGFMKQVQYKVTTMLRDLGADAMLVKRGFAHGNQFRQSHAGYSIPKGVKAGAVLWFVELNDARAFTQSRTALVEYVMDSHGIRLDGNKLIR